MAVETCKAGRMIMIAPIPLDSLRTIIIDLNHPETSRPVTYTDAVNVLQPQIKVCDRCVGQPAKVCEWTIINE